MKTIYVFLLILIALTYACGRCDKQHTYLLTEKSKTYFGNFAVGDKWVFNSNQDLEFLDTLELINRVDTLQFSYTEKECDGDYYQTVSYQLVSKKSNDTLNVQLKSGPYIDTYLLAGSFDHLQLACLLDINKKSGEFKYNSYAKDVLNILPEYEVNGIKYLDVVDITFNQYSPNLPEEAPRYFHALNIGLIEFEIYNESTKQRVTYSMTKYIKK